MKAIYCNDCEIWLNGTIQYVKHLTGYKHHKKTQQKRIAWYCRLCETSEVEAARQDKKKRTLRERLCIKQNLFEIVHCRWKLNLAAGDNARDQDARTSAGLPLAA